MVSYYEIKTEPTLNSRKHTRSHMTKRLREELQLAQQVNKVENSGGPGAPQQAGAMIDANGMVIGPQVMRIDSKEYSLLFS